MRPALKIQSRFLSNLMAAFPSSGVNSSLDNAKSHSKPYDGECVPQATMKYYMTHVPYPLKRKRKHINSFLPAGL
jgi:hypothetical protein